MASALDLAGILRSLDATTLRARLGERTISRPGQVRDAFDLAEALLEPSSVRDALTRLDRVALIAVQAARQAGDAAALLSHAHPAFEVGVDDVERAVERAADRFLVARDSKGVASTFDAVAAVLDDDPTLSLDVLARSLPPVVLEAVEQHDTGAQDPRGSERLFALVIEMAEIVRALESAPARELAKGGLALPETRRLAEAARVDVDDVAGLLAAARAADLAQPGLDGWEPGSAAAAWLEAPWAERWTDLVAPWLESVPPEVRTVLDQRAETSWGEPLITFSEWFFPAGSAWLADRLDAFTHVAELFGLTAGGRPTAVATTLLRRGPAAAHDIVAQLMPEPIETVYLQNDLTVVAPGPLAPELDARLRSIAEVESTGLAATYRISEARLQGALVDGETEQSLREFLGSLSSTGIPQPVDYLLSETAARHGRYRVSAYSPRDDDGVVAEQARQLDAVSRLRADDAALLDTIEVDHTLGSLALVRADGLTMLSRFDAETVYWALTEARYPVVLEDAGRSPLRAPPRRSNRRAAPSSAADPVGELVERVSASSGGSAEDTDRAWIARQLDAAVKGRLTVLVTVAMPDGTTSELQMEPTGVGGGRVRGRDRKSDIERTLPLSSIVAVATPSR